MALSLVSLVVVGLGLVAFGGRLGRRSFHVAALPLAIATVWLVARLDDIVDGRVVSEHYRWVESLGLSIDLRLDGMAATMSIIVTVVGVAVMFYASRYFASDARDLSRLAGLLALFAASMLCLVQADHLLVLFLGWELTTITSFLLIGNRHEESRARAAALHALLITGAGGLALLGGLVVVGQEAGTYRMSEILRDPPPSGTTITVALVAIIAGALTKSAQYPFHAWLPGAMAAPTPVSAYLHSATMVKAGVFLVARFAPTFAGVGVWRPLVLTAGCVTVLLGGLRALRQHDLKLLLAFGTVSQLGLLVILFGAGTPELATAGWVLLVAHAAFKATLFMVLGIIDHQTGTRDIRRLPVLGRGWRGVEVITVMACAAMAGLPVGGAFVAKELAYDSLSDSPFQGSAVVLIAVVVGSMLTAAYAARFWWGAFGAPRRRAAVDPNAEPERPSLAFVLPAAILTVFGFAFGIVPGVGDRLATSSLEAFSETVHLSVWHGAGLPLVLSIVALTGGALIVVADRWVQPVLARGGVVPSGAEIYLASLRRLGSVSSKVTRFVQNGSLPVYAGVILATAAVAPAAAILARWAWGGWPAFGPLRELPVALALVVSALGAAVVRRRFSAALFLGVAGYAMAGLFVLSGAPDLALTQASVETLSTVVFVLVLRRLPERFERQSSSARRLVRLVIAMGVGATVFVLALVAAGHRLPSTVSHETVERAVPDGHGRNVVNVILVDFRGFDTLGEITVLAAAAIGAVALARVGWRAAEERGESSPTASDMGRRMPFVDVSVRVVFHIVLLISLWLLFAGHNQPGGGFVGGLLTGSAIALRYIAGGIEEVRGLSRFRPWTVLGAGVLISAATATVPLLFGAAVLEVGYTSFDVPLIGDVSVSSALVFDVGVYIAVVGMVLMAFEAFGDAPRRLRT